MHNVLSGLMSSMPRIKRFKLDMYNEGDHYSNHVHRQEIEIMYVFQGFIYMGVNNRYIKIQKNNCLIISPDTVHNLILKKNERCRAACIVFNPGRLPVMDVHGMPFFFEQISNKRDSFSLVLDSSNTVKGILQRMYYLKNNENEYTGELMTLYFYELYINLSLLLKENRGEPTSANNRHTKKALEFIGNNYANPISVGDVAEYAGLSARHLARIFMQEFRMTMGEYITFVRIEKAKKLLTETEQTITAIGQRLGYNSSQYFATSFKKFENVSPREYRNQMKE